jgi:hypothetical protein
VVHLKSVNAEPWFTYYPSTTTIFKILSNIGKKEAKYLKEIISSAKIVVNKKNNNTTNLDDEAAKGKRNVNIVDDLQLSLPSPVSYDSKKQKGMLDLANNKIHPE